MAYDQRAGPSTPGRGFPPFSARPSDSVHTQQRSLSASGGGVGNDSGVLRSSALRSTPGPQTTQASFGFGGMREVSTPKSVRWEDALSSPITQQPVVNPGQQQQQPASQYPFSLQYTGDQQHQSQQQQQQQQQLQRDQQQQQMVHQQPVQYQKTQPWTSSAVTSLPAHMTPPNSSYQRSSSSSLPASGPDQSQTTPSVSSSTVVQPSRSVFNTVAVPTSAVASKPSSAIGRPSPSASSTPPQSTAAERAVVTTSYPAIVSRLKWNFVALVLAWLGPRTSLVGRVYWLLLDAAFSILGTEADVYMASGLSWLHRASLLILIINIIEATIMLKTASTPTSTTPGATEIKRKPSLAFPPNRAVSASAPSTASSQATKSKSNTPRHYAQGSPLRDSIFRASAIAQGLGEGRRLPSQTPRLASSYRPESNATPLAAFLARKQEQRMTSGGDVGDISWASGDADLSTDSIEVDRALRAFSAGYEREMSQSVIAV